MPGECGGDVPKPMAARGDSTSSNDVSERVRSTQEQVQAGEQGLQQPELRGTKDRSPARGHLQLGEDVPGVRANGVVRDEE